MTLTSDSSYFLPLGNTAVMLLIQEAANYLIFFFCKVLLDGKTTILINLFLSNLQKYTGLE
jgi:hypothetical protein